MSIHGSAALKRSERCHESQAQRNHCRADDRGDVGQPRGTGSCNPTSTRSVDCWMSRWSDDRAVTSCIPLSDVPECCHRQSTERRWDSSHELGGLLQYDVPAAGCILVHMRLSRRLCCTHLFRGWTRI